MGFEKIEDIKKQLEVAWDAYAKSNKENFVNYLKKIKALSKEHFKQKLGNRMMKAARLKRIVGTSFLFLGIILWPYGKILDTPLSKLSICWPSSFFGISLIAGIYYGYFKKAERKKILTKEEIIDCLTTYIWYGVSQIALSGFICLTFYESFKDMSSELSKFVLAPLFFCSGLTVDVTINYIDKLRNRV